MLSSFDRDWSDLGLKYLKRPLVSAGTYIVEKVAQDGKVYVKKKDATIFDCIPWSSVSLPCNYRKGNKIFYPIYTTLINGPDYSNTSCFTKK